MKTGCIIQVLPALNQGGVERGTIEVAAALKTAGVPNCVISAGGKMVSELEKLGVEHITLPVQTKNPFKILLNAWRLAQIFRAKNAALIHVRSRAPAWSVKIACQRTGMPYSATYHGRYGTKPAWLKKPYNRVMLQGKKVIAVSKFVQQHLLDEYQVLPDHIRLIPRGADINLFNPEAVSTQQVTDFINRHQIPQEHPVISLVGRMSRIKGHTVFLEALMQMKHHELTVLLVGGNPKGDYEAELQEKLKNLPAGITVKMFTVSGDQVPLVYQVSDICVQPSLIPETFGRTIAEAQAMKRIVVAAAHGGACELIADGVTGFLVPVGDTAALATTLDNILDMSPEKRAAIGEAACASVRADYSTKKMCERTLALYRELLG